MESALTDWNQMTDAQPTDVQPNGNSACHLIKSVAEVKNTA
ncbi:MAG: hypothetical protein ABJA66_11135 [Actinomycetota bacterium]